MNDSNQSKKQTICQSHHDYHSFSIGLFATYSLAIIHFPIICQKPNIIAQEQRHIVTINLTAYVPSPNVGISRPLFSFNVGTCTTIFTSPNLLLLVIWSSARVVLIANYAVQNKQREDETGDS